MGLLAENFIIAPNSLTFCASTPFTSI